MNGENFIDALRALEEGEDVAPLVRLHGPEATIWSPQVDGKQLPKGADGAERFWREYRDAFNGIRSTFHSVTDAEGRSVLEWESTGEMRDGSPFTYRGVSVLEWEDNRIARFAAYFDPSPLTAAAQAPALDAASPTTRSSDGHSSTAGSPEPLGATYSRD